MTERTVRRVGAYAKLLANYYADDAIIEAGEAAELLFCRALAWCATSDSDGYITDAQLTRFPGTGMKDAPKRAARLVAVGVWERVDGGFVIRAWTRIHETAEEKERHRKTDRERKRNQAGVQKDSARNPDGFHTGSAPDSLSLIQSSAGTEQTQSSSAEAGAKDAPETIEQRSNRLTKTYVDAVPLSNFAAIRGVVRKAINANYDDQPIIDALSRLAADGRSVTTDTLRYELEGRPPSRAAPAARPSTTDQAVQNGLALAQRLEAQETA